MKITQKAFVEAMTTNETIFAGVTKIFDLPYFKEWFDKEVEKWKFNKEFVEKRTCKARSKDLAFSNGSYLGFDGYEKKEFFQIDSHDYTMYIVHFSWLDEWENKTNHKSLIYLVTEIG